MKKKITAVLLIMVFAMVMMVGCGKDEKTDGEKEAIKIGVLYPLTGNMAKMGQEELRGTELAIKVINESGGINGHPIKVVKADAPDPQAGTTEAERLISVEKVPIIVGSYSSGVAFAASAVAERNQTIFWEQGGVADNITQRGFKYVFRPSARAFSTAYGGAETIEKVIAPKLGKDSKSLKVAVIYESSAFGTSTGDGTAKLLQEKGINVGLKESYEANSQDLSSLVLKLKKFDPDVIHATTYLNDGILLMKQFVQLGYNPKSVIFGGNATVDFRDGVGADVLEGMISFEVPQKHMNQDKCPGQKEFFENYKKVYGHDPYSAHSLRSYVGTLILGDILKQCAEAEKVDPDKFVETAHKMDQPVSTTAAGWGVKFAPPGDPNMGTNELAFTVGYVWHDGETYAVYPQEVAYPGADDFLKIPLPPLGK